MLGRCSTITELYISLAHLYVEIVLLHTRLTCNFRVPGTRSTGIKTLHTVHCCSFESRQVSTLTAAFTHLNPYIPSILPSADCLLPGSLASHYGPGSVDTTILEKLQPGALGERDTLCCGTRHHPCKM